MEQTLAEARREKMWEHEGQDLLILGGICDRAPGTGKPARKYLQEAIQSEKQVGLVGLSNNHISIFPNYPRRREI